MRLKEQVRASVDLFLEEIKRTGEDRFISCGRIVIHPHDPDRHLPEWDLKSFSFAASDALFYFAGAPFQLVVSLKVAPCEPTIILYSEHYR